MDSLEVHIEAKDNHIEVWKTLASLFDKSDHVSVNNIENKIHEFDPKDLDRIESFLAEIKIYNEKLNNCGKDYKKNGNSLIIIALRVARCSTTQYGGYVVT